MADERIFVWLQQASLFKKGFFLLFISFSWKPTDILIRDIGHLQLIISLAHRNYSLQYVYFPSHYWEQIITSINFPLTKASEFISITTHFSFRNNVSQQHPYRPSNTFCVINPTSAVFGLFNAAFHTLLELFQIFDWHR